MDKVIRSVAYSGNSVYPVRTHNCLAYNVIINRGTAAGIETRVYSALLAYVKRYVPLSVSIISPFQTGLLEELV